MATNLEMYEQFQERQQELAGMLKSSITTIEKLDMNTETLHTLEEKVQNDSFKIQVAGTFKNGKSTFINSLLGEEVLPAYATPCTAVINELKWGEEKKAVIHFCDPLPERLPSKIPDAAMAHMQKYHMQNIPPLTIPYDEVEDYVVIPMGSDPSEMLLESPYAKVELFWPLDLLENGVEVIDSPGLNEHKTRTKVTMDYLSKADAILFVLNATQLCSQDEMTFIEEDLHENGFEDPFFVVNRFDLIREKERDRVQKFAHVKLDEFTSDTAGIYFVSALEALEAKEEQDEERFEASGMKTFERDLTEFLTKNKGKAKLAQPTKELKHTIDVKAMDVIKTQRNLLSKSLDDVKKKQAEIKPRLADLNKKKEQTRSKMAVNIERSKNEISRSARNNTNAIINSIPGWIEDFKPQTSLMPPTKKKMEAVVTEITNYVVSCIDKTQKEWRKKEFEPLLSEKADYIFDSVQDDLSSIFNEIDAINVDISGNSVETKGVPVWQRVVGAAGGLLLGDVGLAFSAGMNGVGKELAQTLAIELGAGAVLSLLGLLNPVTIVMVLGGAGIFNLMSGQSNALKKLKDSISEKMVEQLRNSAQSNAQKIADGCGAKFEEIAETIIDSIDKEIKETENQMQVVVDELKKGEANVRAKERELDVCENELKEISKQLAGFIFQLLES